MTPPLRWTRHEDLAMRLTPSVPREEYLAYMTFQQPGLPIFTEFLGPMIGLKEEWLAQGATPEELDFSAFRFRLEGRAGIPVNTGCCSGLKPEILEDTPEYSLTRDHLGRRMKLWKRTATLPLPLDYPVKNMDDWRRIKPWYEFSEERFCPGWEEAAQQAREKQYVLCVAIPGGFDEPRQLMGEENLCLAYFEQPELVHDMLNTMRKTAIQVLDRVSKTVQVDLLFVHEDMAGKSGSLVGPRQIRAFIAPYYRAIWDLLRSRGAQLFDQDSDGDMTAVIDAFLDAGLNCLHPLEPAAGMDGVKIREKYGTRLALSGGLDKHVLRRSLEEIEAELEYKLPPLIATGGVRLSLDHRIPNGSPLEHYRFYIRKAWEIIERETA